MVVESTTLIAALNRGRGQPLTRASGGKAGRLALQVFQRLPEQLLGHGGRPRLVGVRQIVARRRCRPTNGHELPGEKPQTIADIIQTDRVSQLCEEQRDDMAPGTKRARFVSDARVSSQFGDKMSGNEIAQLTQNGEF